MNVRRDMRTRKRTRRSPASRPRIAFVIEEPKWRKETQALRLMRRAMRMALEELPTNRKRVVPGVSVLLANDARLRALNFDFRGKEKVTNVLSFPAGGGEADHLGDIALAFGLVKKEARAQNKSFAAHAAHLALHGALHLLGYDHEKKNEANEMESLEIRLLGLIGLTNPYAPRLYTRAGRPA
jgi:probable rRNA maturation factor